MSPEAEQRLSAVESRLKEQRRELARQGEVIAAFGKSMTELRNFVIEHDRTLQKLADTCDNALMIARDCVGSIRTVLALREAEPAKG